MIGLWLHVQLQVAGRETLNWEGKRTGAYAGLEHRSSGIKVHQAKRSRVSY